MKRTGIHPVHNNCSESILAAISQKKKVLRNTKKNSLLESSFPFFCFNFLFNPKNQVPLNSYSCSCRVSNYSPLAIETIKKK